MLHILLSTTKMDSECDSDFERGEDDLFYTSQVTMKFKNLIGQEKSPKFPFEFAVTVQNISCTSIDETAMTSVKIKHLFLEID